MPSLALFENQSYDKARFRPILPPRLWDSSDGFAGMAVDEERDLSRAYRATKRVRKPEGQGLNDLYVRFFRMAERRIAETTGRGVVCFISNYSWLDGLSFTGMRERYLENFGAIRIDCLNGDKYKTGKVAPDGSPDPSIFSTESNSVGIQVGTAITTLVRKADHTPATAIDFRHLWGRTKLAVLNATGQEKQPALYDRIEPVLPLGLPFAETEVSADWFDWPALPDLLPVSFPGVKTDRDAFLVDIDLRRLKERVADYFNPDESHEAIARRYPSAMRDTSSVRLDAQTVRERRLAAGQPDEAAFLRCSYRPFDNRWLYWEEESGLLARPRPEYRPHVFAENLWLTAAQHVRRGAAEPQTCFTRHLGQLHLIERSASLFPAWLRQPRIESDGADDVRRPNLSASAARYLAGLGGNVEDLFHFVLATLHEKDYLEANAGALRIGWPRIPLPGWPHAGAADTSARFAATVELGRQLARLLDLDRRVPGVTQGDLRPDAAVIAVPATADGHQMTGDDFALSAGWGHYGTRDAVMPGQGRAVERTYNGKELQALGDAIPALGESTFDIYLNAQAYWRNVPAAVWQYRLGGYQVLKKWLSYRERQILGRPLKAEEVQHFADTARRLAAMLTADNLAGGVCKHN